TYTHTEYWTWAGSLAKTALGNRRCFSWSTLRSKRRLLRRQRAARSRERPSGTTPPTFVLQLPARGAGSVDFHSAFISSTARLVDAIAREYGVLVNRYESTKRRFSPQLDALNSASRVCESRSVRETASCPLTYCASAAISPPTDEVSYKWS